MILKSSRVEMEERIWSYILDDIALDLCFEVRHCHHHSRSYPPR